jgi:hypothetical protein
MPYAVPHDFSPADLAFKIDSQCDLLATYLQRLFDQVEALDQMVRR